MERKLTDKINLSNTFKLYEEALKLIPGAILGIRRPYNFVEGDILFSLNLRKVER